MSSGKAPNRFSIPVILPPGAYLVECDVEVGIAITDTKQQQPNMKVFDIRKMRNWGESTHSRKIDIVSDDISHPK